MGAGSARSSKVQLGHGIMSGATLLAQLSPSLSITGTTLCLASSIHKSSTTHKQRWHACTRGHIDAPVVLLHACMHLCGCAMGTNTCQNKL